MNLFIILAILIVNAVAILLVYQFIKQLDKKEKLFFIVIAIAINYIVVSIIFWLATLGVEKIITQNIKSFITYMFVPVNMILVMPFIANTYMKLKEKKLKSIALRNRIIFIAVLAVIVLLIEFFYFKNIGTNIQNYSFLK